MSIDLKDVDLYYSDVHEAVPFGGSKNLVTMQVSLCDLLGNRESTGVSITGTI